MSHLQGIKYNYITFLIFFIGTTIPIKAQKQITDSVYNFTFTHNTIYEVIDSIREKTNLGISFKPDILTSNKAFTSDFKNFKLQFVLDSIFKTYNLSYRIVGTTIAVTTINKIEKAYQQDTILVPDTISIIQLTGKIIDNNKKPISFANIFLKNRPLGTISNAEGNFLLKVPKELVNDSVYFSYIGYNIESRKITDLTDTSFIITMTEASIRLKEVTIRNIKPDELIKKAIEKIPDNYSKIQLLVTGFYREIIKENNDYVSITEAVLKIFKYAYNNYQTDQVSIYKARKSPFVKKMDTILFKFQGGIHTNLMLDIAKNHSNFISGENLDYYNYKLDEITSVQGHNVYVIDFDQKDYINYPLFKGKIYIDMESLAIIKAEFMLSPKGIKYAAETMVRKAPSKVKVKPVEANYLVNYTVRNNTWYLSNMREQAIFKVKKRYTFYNKTFESIAEMVITQTDSIDVKRFKVRETIKPSDILTEKIQDYDENFWGSYNIIKPDESLEEAFDKIRDKLKIQEYKFYR